MNLYQNRLYLDDLDYTANLDLPWEKLDGSTVLISGATGLIGSFFIDVLLRKSETDRFKCSIIALGRDSEKAKRRFSKYWNDENLTFLSWDINKPLETDGLRRVDYVLHLASNTHPLQYSLDPIGTITTNIIGARNLLDYSAENSVSRFVFASSNEIYGENRGDTELFDEKYCGYINSNTLRAGYPESKRCGEALCQAYKTQKQLDVVIPRLTRSYGPTMLRTDSKAISQFIKKGVAGEDIVLKSAGTQYYSYQYVSDSVSGLLTVLTCGENGEAYNIADANSDIMLKDLAEIIAEMNGRKVVYEVPDLVESAGYSVATKARLDGTKLKLLGWSPRYSIKEGICRTITILRDTVGEDN